MLSVRDLHAYYGRAHILHGLSLEAGAAVIGVQVPDRQHQCALPR